MVETIINYNNPGLKNYSLFYLSLNKMGNDQSKKTVTVGLCRIDYGPLFNK